MKIRIFAFAVATAAMIASTHAQQTTDDQLGTVHSPISCTAIQGKFDRAVALLHNFFYPETAKAFQAIITENPNCAMAYWGLAMSELPNPLVPPFPAANVKAGSEAIQQGKAAKTQTPREAEYLAAIEVFYKDYDKIDHNTRAGLYEQAMQRLHEHYPDDSEAAIFYALALNGAVDLKDKAFTKQLKAAVILNEEAKKQPNHPGIAHYMIHSYDFAPLAAMCVSTAKLYDKIAPASPHALHMPSHIYSILGMWEDSVRSNLATKAAADDYAVKNFPDRTYPIVPHLLDFLAYAYLQTARDRDAQQVIEAIPKLKPVLVAQLSIDTALAAIPARYALERGRWDEAAQLPYAPASFRRPSRSRTSPAPSALPVRAMRRQPAPRSSISTRSKQSLTRPRTITGQDRPASRNRRSRHGSCSPVASATGPSQQCAKRPILTTPARRTWRWRTSWCRSGRCWANST